MTKNVAEEAITPKEIELELNIEEIEELEAIVAPGVATSPGPLRNHNETIVRDVDLSELSAGSEL